MNPYIWLGNFHLESNTLILAQAYLYPESEQATTKVQTMLEKLDDIAWWKTILKFVELGISNLQ